MGESSQGLHEAAKSLSRSTRDMHRALVSLREELEAVDWYRQRVDACADEALRAVLAHNMREEIEHACMLIEWLRRNDEDFDANLAIYIGAEGDITAAEGRTEAAEREQPEVVHEAEPAAAGPLRLTIGSLKEGR
jgi:ferritin-like protein